MRKLKYLATVFSILGRSGAAKPGWRYTNVDKMIMHKPRSSLENSSKISPHSIHLKKYQHQDVFQQIKILVMIIEEMTAQQDYLLP